MATLTRTWVRGLTASARVLSHETPVLYPWTPAGIDRPYTVRSEKNVFKTVDSNGIEGELIDYSSNLISTLVDPRIFTPTVMEACESGLVAMAPEHRTEAKDFVARTLIENSPIPTPEKARVWFGCTGSDAVSTAVWASLRKSERTGLVYMQHSFHGADFHASQVGTDPRGINKKTGHMKVHTHPPLPRPTCEEDYDWCMSETKAVFRYLHNDIGVLVVDGSSGSPLGVPWPKGYLPELTQLAHSYGIKVVVDEVMSGLKRSGAGLFAASNRDGGVYADFVIYGKALTNGMIPLSAVVVNDAEEFDEAAWPHGSTFSGHYLGMALCKDMLQHISTPEFDNLINEKEALLRDTLTPLISDPDAAVCDVRGSGLMWTVFFDVPAEDAATFRAQLKSRFGIRQFGLANRVMISPTADITKEQLEYFNASVRTLSAEYHGDVAAVA